MDLDRFAKTERVKPAVRARAKRLRAEPTWTEAKLWDRLRKLDIRVRRQAPIGPYVADFACLRARLVIEVDGGIHNHTEVALRDLRRDEWFASQGYRVLRINSARIPADLDAVMADITQAIRLKAPLPLEGEGVGGWGGAATSNDEARETQITPDKPLARQPASTPSQPSPLKGAGS